MEDFYTAKEARIKLRVSEDKFQYLVRTRTIEKIVPPGRTYGVYARAEIDKLASTLNTLAAEHGKEREKTLIRVARLEDSQEIYELAKRVLERSGENAISAEGRTHYLALPNSEICHVLVRNRHIIAFFTILPLKHDKMMHLMYDEVQASTIPVEDYAKFVPGEAIDCFIWEVMADPDNKHIGAYAMKKMLNFFHILGKRGVEIKGLYVKATSPTDMDICRKLHMKEMPSSEVSQLPSTSFEMNVQETRNKFTRNYLQALKNYKKRYVR
ncbi:MAG: hypothetical protein NVSMB27_02220 [Ktedonobacteraceae bacterium]